MYIYNVTANISEAIHKEWLTWMKQTHIPAMLATGKFSKAKMVQVMIEEEMGGVTYSVQYTTDSAETLEAYYNEDAPNLRNEELRLYKDQLVSFRTELKVISEQYSMSLKN